MQSLGVLLVAFPERVGLGQEGYKSKMGLETVLPGCHLVEVGTLGTELGLHSVDYTEVGAPLVAWPSCQPFLSASSAAVRTGTVVRQLLQFAFVARCSVAQSPDVVVGTPGPKRTTSCPCLCRSLTLCMRCRAQPS